MKKKETKKRTSIYGQNRQCFMADDGTAYFYEWLNPVTGRYERMTLTAGKEGVTEEIILMLDCMDHDEELKNYYEDKYKDPEFERLRDLYESDLGSETYPNPWNKIFRSGDDPVEIIFDEKKESPDITKVREIIDTKCNERQQNLFFAHFGEGKQLEQIRKEEVAATGKEKKHQAIVNAKNKILQKVADEYGVTPVKRKKVKKKD